MNLETIIKSEIFLLYLPSILISYFIIRIFIKHPSNNFEKPYDYYKYYILDNFKDYLKMFLISPFVFIIIKYLYTKNSQVGAYNFNIISKIVEELYLMIIKIAKGTNRIN
jgi:hypothetical protein